MSTTPAETVDTTGLAVATEAIDFQDGSFFKDLVSKISDFPREQRSDMRHEGWAKLETQLEASIKKFTGMTVNVNLSQDAAAWIVTPVIDWSHVLNIHQVDQVANPEELFKFFSKAKKTMSSCVDLKKGFISGELAKEATAHMEIGRSMLYRKVLNAEFTDEEVAAFILHEIGHFFTQFEFLDRSVSTNQVMAELSRNLMHEKEPGKRETVIKAAGKELNMDRNVVENLLGSDDKTVTTVMFTTGMKTIRTQSGHSFYDMNTWEMLADQFAARHGAGKHMFAAVNKMIQWYPDWSMESRASFYFGQVSSFVGGLILLAAGITSLIGGGVVFGIIGVLFGFCGMLSTNGSINEPIYDVDFTRLKRIRNQHVQAIKLALGRNKSKFNTALVTELTKEVQQMDLVLEKGREQPTVMARLYAYFSANESNRQANVAFQKELEGLAHNDLYAKAAALKTI